jgi:hypothetical protein
MAIVKKYRYGLPKRSREDQINSVISVYIARFDQEAASGRDQSYRLPPGGGELKLNPVVGTAGRGYSGFNPGQIWFKVSVKIRNRKLWPRSNRSNSCVPCFLSRRTAAHKAKDEQQ